MPVVSPEVVHPPPDVTLRQPPLFEVNAPATLTDGLTSVAPPVTNIASGLCEVEFTVTPQEDVVTVVPLPRENASAPVGDRI